MVLPTFLVNVREDENLNELFQKKLTPKCSNEHVECSFDNRVKKFPTEKRWKIQNSLFSKTVKKLCPSRAISPLKSSMDTQRTVLTDLPESYARRLELFAHCPKMTKQTLFWFIN